MAENIFDHRGGRAHFIGIGGSSMSGLAGYLQELGFTVTGSDRTASHKTEHLQERGIRVNIGQAAGNVHGADVIVYSAAISRENPERAEAERLGIPQIERCELIGQLMEGYPFAIGVSGTHGKTTTTSMLAQAFMQAGADPTIHIGGELDFIGGSTRVGGRHDFICEACEFNGSFLRFKSCVTVTCYNDRGDACGLETVIEVMLEELVRSRDSDGTELIKTDHCEPELVMTLQNEHDLVTLLDAE